MTAEELQALLAGGLSDDSINKITKLKPSKPKDISEVLEELDPSQHEVMDKVGRPDKMVTTEDDDGNEQTRIEPVARLPIPFQKRIVNTAAAFLCGNPIKLDSTPKDQLQTDFLSVIQRTWDDCKLDYESMQLAAHMLGETECAELWYQVPVDNDYWQGTENEGAKFTYRFLSLSPSKGDMLYPVFDPTGDLIGFGRGYFVVEGDDKIEHFDFYTESQIILGTKQSSDWVVVQNKNPIGKIPVIYYSQPLPAWNDVQALIERLEASLSNNADTNDYNGSPILSIEGDVKGLSTKGERGKVVELHNGAKASYLVWPNAPEAIRMENEKLQQLIYSMTSTPDISFEQMRALGVFSGIAIRMLFMDAHMNAARNEGIFGKGIQRRINYLKKAISVANTKFEKVVYLNIKPKFEYYMPQNVLEAMQVLTEGVGAGKSIMSQETAVRLNPMVRDPDTEITQMKEEGLYGPDIQIA